MPLHICSYVRKSRLAVKRVESVNDSRFYIILRGHVIYSSECAVSENETDSFKMLQLQIFRNDTNKLKLFSEEIVNRLNSRPI
jgi:hypothetical protein